ncbi:hypothetical protein WME79_09780 [Sorangium sp. So ce726]|uniref:hypothetical protein n=1 Tax=Sorangium sp. So ce726 TaxID=3133319 RepID=UPI003F63D869
MSAGLACQPEPTPSASDTSVEVPLADDGEVPLPDDGEVPLADDGEVPLPDDGEVPLPDDGGNPNPLCPGPVEPDTSAVVALSLPARTRSTLIRGDHLASAQRSTPTRVVVEERAALAIGPDYPSTVTMRLDSVLDPRCGPILGDITIDEIGDIQGAIAVEKTGPTTFAVSVSEEGTSTFEVSGVIAVPEGGLDVCTMYDDTRELPITLLMTVQAARPRWQFEIPASCGARAVIQSNRPLPIIPVALDAAGQPFSPQNVEHPAVDVVGTGVGLRVIEGGAPSEIVATGDGSVVITAADGGDPREVSVIPAARIDAMDVVFAIPGAAGGGRLLADGETYVGGFARTGNRVVAVISGLASGGVPLCSEARTEDFEVTSSTPEACAVDGLFCESNQIPLGDLVTRSAEVITDGTCAVRIDAPAFAGGAGLSAEISVTLEDTDEMRDLTP